MTKLDLIILILVASAGLGCYRSGFTRSVWGVFALGAGCFTASHFWPPFATLVQKFIENPTFAKWLSIVALIIFTAIIIDIFFERIQRIIEKGVLGWLNRLLGLGFGIASCGLLIAFALILLNTYGRFRSDEFKTEIANSRFAPQLMDMGNHVWTVSKARIQRQLESE